MIYKVLASAALLISGCCIGPVAVADDNCGDGATTVQFVREDLVNLKHRMETAIAAIPQPKSPYGKASENWNLPSYACKDKSGMLPVQVTFTSQYTTDASMQKMGKQYTKELMAAEAKGDYQTVMKLTQQMQQKAYQVSAADQGMTEVDMTVSGNPEDSMTIDPDAVIRDGNGFIALRTAKDASSGTESISVYFDPVALENAHQLASFDSSGDWRVDSKVALLTLRVDLNGPAGVLETMIKNMDASKVLGVLSSERKKAAGG